MVVPECFFRKKRIRLRPHPLPHSVLRPSLLDFSYANGFLNAVNFQMSDLLRLRYWRFTIFRRGPLALDGGATLSLSLHIENHGTAQVC